MIEIFRCGHKTQPRLWVNGKIYCKARRLYSRRKSFKRIKPVRSIVKQLTQMKCHEAEHGLYDYEWYEDKGRIFIFNRRLSIASFVVKGNKIYNPLIACGSIYSSIYKKIFKNNWLINLLVSLYEEDIELLIRERE